MNKRIWLIAASFFLVTIAVVTALPRAERVFSAATIGSAPAEPQQQPKFTLDCAIEALTTSPVQIDKTCGVIGKATANSNSARQNTIKNRFCLPGSLTTPVDITFKTIDDLQTAADNNHIPFGRKPNPNDPTKFVENLPSDRSVLGNLMGQLGEGSLVRLEGFVFKAQHSNTFVFGSGGESVNCNAKSLKGNDIHIALAETKAGTKIPTTTAAKTRLECGTVTAEISPHHRSAIYNQFDTNPSDFLKGKTQKAGQDKLRGSPLPLQGARVRITGQLFFDASHAPCRNGSGAPPRRSIWEIHPVFAIEVFEKSTNKFIPLEEWIDLNK